MSQSQPIALITGGTGGIGQAIAKNLLEQGYQVLLAARRTHISLDDELQNRCHILEMDVTEVEQVTTAFHWVKEHYGRLDLLINAAGGTHFKLLQRMKVADWDQSFSLHAKGCFLCSQQAIKLMKPQGHGLIIHIASLAVKQPKPGFAAYGAAKAALANLSESLNAEVGRYGIRSIVINPSYVDTPLLGEHSYKPEELIPPGVIADFIQTICQLPHHVTLPELTLSTVSL